MESLFCVYVYIYVCVCRTGIGLDLTLLKTGLAFFLYVMLCYVMLTSELEMGVEIQIGDEPWSWGKASGRAA